MVGLDDAAIFGQGTAKRLALSDRRVLKEREAVNADEEVYLDGRRRYLQISKAHFLHADGEPSGTRQDERRVGKVCVSTYSSRWAQKNQKQRNARTVTTN